MRRTPNCATRKLHVIFLCDRHSQQKIRRFGVIREARRYKFEVIHGGPSHGAAFNA